MEVRDGVCRVPLTVAAKNHALGSKVIDRETKRIKLNRTRIVASKLANGKKVINNRWNDKNIIKMERSDERSLYGCAPYGKSTWKCRSRP